LGGDARLHVRRVNLLKNKKKKSPEKNRCLKTTTHEYGEHPCKKKFIEKDADWRRKTVLQKVGHRETSYIGRQKTGGSIEGAP